VLSVFAIRLTPPGTVATPAYTLAGAPGDTVYCRFDVENLGNARDSVTVSSATIPPSTATVASVIVFFDANSNGVFDAGEDDPWFLAADAGGTMTMDVGFVIPGSGAAGDAYVEVAATSVNDAAASDRSVVRVTNTGPPPSYLFLGPAGNPRAAPRGEGSPDDVTEGFLGYSDVTYSFENDLLNDAPYPQDVELILPSLASLSPDVQLSVVDSAGTPLLVFSSDPQRFNLGTVDAGRVQRFQVLVTSTTGEPLCKLSPSQLSLDITARSLTDTLQQNHTIDRLVPPAQVDPRAAISMRQTFREAIASAGDVVTLVVTVENITDSLRVDDIEVTEHVQPQLDFLGSDAFRWNGRGLVWRAGSLRGGESRTAVAKFVANTRVADGKARAVGTSGGRSESNDDVFAGPVASSIRIENDIFGDEGVIIGDVFVDADADGRRDRGEKGLGGVAVYLESGEYAVTDSAGAFSLPRVFSGYRMVRLDETGLPAGVHLGDDPSVGRPNERLVHLLPGGHARVAFPVVADPAPPADSVDVARSISCQERVSLQPAARLYRVGSVSSSYFAVGKAELGAGVVPELQPVVAFLEEHPDWRLLIEGHTDSQPMHSARFPSNLSLSIARAEAVRDHFVVRGIDAARIAVRGYGDARPVASNETIEGRRDNRRVELTFVPPGVDLDEGIDASRVEASLRDFQARSAPVRATILWQIATNDEGPRSVTLAIGVPSVFASPEATVRLGDRAVEPESETYRLEGFSRDHPIECSVSFDAAAADTAAIRSVTATLWFDGDSVVVHPFDGGSSTNSTTHRDLVAWTERVAAAALPLPPHDAATPDTALADVPKGVVSLTEPREASVFTNRDRILVRARMPLGTDTRLLVDGVAVPQTRVGQRDVDVANGVERITWYGVKIEPGWNTLVVESRLIDGAVEVDSVHVALSSRTASLTAVRKRVLVPADGKTREGLAFEVVDGLGLPVADGVVATVVEGEALVDAVDVRPDARGLQVPVLGGRVTLTTRPRNETGRGVVAVECDGYRAETDVSFVSAQRPFFATGIVDLKLGAYDAGGSGSGEGVDDFHDGFEAKGQSRLFVQGVLPHDVGVTARLDTKKRYDDPLLKDMDPERQYPVFGDASSVHHAAPSQGGNYVSLDRGESFVRYGDFRTPFDEGEFLSYRRAATGLTSALVDGSRSFKTFVTKTDFSTHQDEIPADGTSGFYYLSRAPMVEYSEQLSLETRDRYRPERVIDVRPLARNRDYTINYFDGSILFKEPVDAFDRDFNPVVIVATYEVETGDDAQYLYGARGDLAEGSKYRVGSTAVARTGDGDNYALFGADGEVALRGLRLSGEVARSEDDAAGGGNAFKLEASYRQGKGEHSVYLRRVDGDFTNPSFRGASHELASLKSGFQSRLDMGGDVTLEADGFTHRLDRTGERKENLRALARFRHPLLDFQGGVRFARHKQPTDDRHASLVVLGIETGGQNAAGLSTVWEKNLGAESVEDYPDRIKTQASLPLGPKHKLVAGHEYLTARGRGGSHQASAGVESRLGEATTAYTKYSMNRTANDERMGAVTGLKHDVRIRDGVSGTLGLEAYRSLSDRPDDEYVTVKTGLGVRAPGEYLAEGQYEYRWQTLRTKHLLRFNAARELRSGFTALTKNVLSIAPEASGRDELGYHGNFAVAHRPPAGIAQSLWMIRNDYERYTPVDPEAVTWRLVFSGDVNVALAPEHEVRLKYAFKHVEDCSFGSSTTANADLALGQYVYRFAQGWDADLWGRVVRHRGGGTVETGSGVEVGRLFLRTLRVAAGYSVNGFDDPDFAGTDAWSRGFGVRVQLLLSDWLLDELEVNE